MAINSIMFGSGVLTLRDSAGNSYPCGTLSDVGVDFSSTTKELRGSGKFAVAVAAAGSKIGLKAKFATINGSLLAAVMGGTSSTGAKFIQTDQKTPTAGSATVTPPSSGTFVTDLGVTFASNGQPLKLTTGAPALGEYKNTLGVYTFNASEVAVLISYVYSVATGETVSIANSTMGLVTTFSVYTFSTFTDSTGTARKMGFHFPAAIAPKLSFAMKNEDFTQEDLDLEAFADASGNVAYFYNA